MSNVLAIPLVGMTVETGNNEDWIESILYTVNVAGSRQLDLRGINFELEVRRAPGDHEIILQVSTDNRLMAVAPLPNFGYLLIQVPVATMQYLEAGDYVADMVASDAAFSRKIIDMSLTIVEGITR